MSGKLLVTVAKDAGFCFGVRDAIEKAKETAAKHGKVYMLGNIVHNERVVSDLEKRNIRVIKSLYDATDAPVLFRAHGTIPELWQKAADQGVGIIDATCPLVYEIHHEIKKLHAENRRIFIIGDHGHDEVVAIQAQVPDATIISTPDEARAIGRVKQAGIVSQSTQMMENVQEIINILMMQVFDLKFVNTICFPTRRNQDQIKELAAVNDVMIVVGSYTSANTKRLVFVAKTLNPRTYQVEDADDVDIEWFKEAKSVGVSAGASSPDDLIQEVVQRIKSI
ncbi:MAG TPA: 4-hydroxy-3-methylbut-2-enyl diphosphate reductase [Candidatus Marinimicrobia bacterium]|nr:MAG: 4-hydroxy-3-methylbut-2-enyl diphosphate reductase [Candidatus Marinimicrobia bacterium CG1_02_48_14]PIZ63613.1 MAG: 4-hydroxy-3-methylbut-2-enyl diphosphate reductase [Candidatus Marinimicrobia bacterium CG_4_10_14_0_2_um_filter_48_9]PJA51482.1 MAG: 4-hydroxy-3-methylbut-2-enyl diphosphate reductase [Candidatus Marinimicrobia bacterium CG_4_9_14_3_um_filter_48_9]HCW77158.1 4-hydroxy-3-methylbut-2-enyl diphosphate reductase [Candidatus Neomarinimicrobiota bacterium]